MPGISQPVNRGDEPSMSLQRPSTGKSQDVRHILVKTFRELFTRDAIAPETVKNLSVSKGGDDPYHERYVEALQKVFSERQRRMEEASMLERHIMQAQARAMSADERQLNRARDTCDQYDSLGLPPGRSNFRSCLDTELLKKHKLLTPEDYATEEPPAVPPPAVDKVPSYARGTVTSRQHTRDDLFLPPVQQQSPIPQEPTTGRSQSDIGSLVSEEPINENEKDEVYLARFPRNDAWKHQLNENQRELERRDLNNLNSKVNYLRNPRYVPPSAPPGGRSLVKSRRVKPKEIGIQPKAEPEPESKEPSQVFLVSPPAVVFTDYKIGQVYEITLTLKNVSACIRQCRALPPSTNYFSVGLGQFPGEHGLVAPGMSCHYAIRFNPDSLRDFDDEIKIQTQSNVPLIVPILGRRPPPKLTLPATIDVGHCLVGGCHVTQLVLKNEGGHGRFCIMPSSAWPTTNFKSVVRNGNVSIPPFDIRPSVLEIDRGQTGLMEIVFQPPSVKSYSIDMCMVCDNCHVKHFTVTGESQRAGVDLVSIERGTTEPLPGELNDSTAQHLIKFDQLNPFTYTDRTAVLKNTTNVSLPFQWMIYKPQFDSPGADDAKRKYERVPDVDSVFSVHPPTGILPPNEITEFKITYAPPVVDKFHSVLHLLLNMVPSSIETSSSKGSSAAAGEKDGAKTKEDGQKAGEEEDNLSEIIVHHGELPPFTDVTALEIEVKGESVPLSVVLHPYSMHVHGKNLVGTTLKKMVTMANHSHSTITFQWDPYTDDYILEVEPPFGELDPGMAMDMELSITGPRPGRIDHTLYCHVMNLEQPLHLQVVAEFKGPEVTIDQPDLNFGLVRLGQTVRKYISLNNMAQIITKWSIMDSPAPSASSSSEDIFASTELTFEPSGGELKPLESKQICVTFHPLSLKSFKRVIEVFVEEGQNYNIACYAEVQSPQVCFLQCELTMPEVYKWVPTVTVAKILNQTLIPTVFEFGQPFGDDCEDCSIEIETPLGELRPRQEKHVKIQFTALKEKEFSEVRIPCKVEGLEKPLILALFCNAKGLAVSYSVSNNAHDLLDLAETRLDFGQEVPLGSTPRMYIHLRNETAIAAPFTLNMENFFAKPPSPPSDKRDTDMLRTVSTRRTMLGKTPNLADPLSKTPGKAAADLCAAMLSTGKGASFVPVPAAGTLGPFSEEIIEVTAYSDMWGEYVDHVICKVGDLDITRIPVTMTVVGCPLAFQMTSGLPDLKPVVRFGTHVAGTATCTRSMRVRNNSPYDIRVDWQVSNIVEDDPKLIDMVVCFGTPFPLLDKEGNEIVPPREVPVPVIREPTDYIPDSIDSSQATSRETTEAAILQETAPKTVSTPSLQRPKVVSLFYHTHEGQLSKAPYSIKPRQLVIPAKGHANVSVSFTPHPTEEVTEDMDCNGFIYGFLNLNGDRAKGEEGKVTRSLGYECARLRLDMTAHLKPALLTIECAEEEGMRYTSAMSSLLKEDGQLLAESLSVNQVMLSNLTLTPLSFRLVTKKPFMLVDLEPSSNKEGNTRAQSTEMHTLKPRHNLIVKVAFQTTSGLLSEIMDEYLDNNREVPESGRKIEMVDNLVMEFNNGSTQTVPLHATLTVPQFELSKESLNFGTCLVGQTRELQLMILNTTSSHTSWSVCQESKSDSCATDTFKVEPSSGLLEAHITHISNSKTLLKIFFLAKHAEGYSAVFTFHGILGESPRRLYVRGQGSYDGKHEAVLNI